MKLMLIQLINLGSILKIHIEPDKKGKKLQEAMLPSSWRTASGAATPERDANPARIRKATERSTVEPDVAAGNKKKKKRTSRKLMSPKLLQILFLNCRGLRDKRKMANLCFYWLKEKRAHTVFLQ